MNKKRTEEALMRAKVINVLSVGLLAGMLLSASQSFAETRWQQHHPRRVEVNGRLQDQYRRIDAGLSDHELTRGEAQQLRAEDRGVLTQERIDASGDHSHLTKLEQRQLNREENAISGQIRSDRVAGD
jgi:hypothetical protein